MENKSIQIQKSFGLEDDTSGTKKFKNRPILQDAIKTAKRLRVPLVVYSLSRLGRTYEVGEFLDSNKGKIQLDILDRPVIDHKLVGFDIAINKYEREVISERTKAALARIKNEGKLTR